MGFDCYAYCYNNCTGSCDGGCKGCTSCTSCSGCSGCSGYCRGGCSGCGDACSYSCTYSCSGGCSGCSSCSGTCNTACNSTCNTTVQATNIANLTLNDYFMASDITKIKDAIKFEVVDRRGETLANTVTFSAGEMLDDAKIAQIIANLAQTGQTVAYSASEGATALKVLGTDLIAKIKAANNATIGLPY